MLWSVSFTEHCSHYIEHPHLHGQYTASLIIFVNNTERVQRALQHHPGLHHRLGGTCANSIGHDKKRDDMRYLTRISVFQPLL